MAGIPSVFSDQRHPEIALPPLRPARDVPLRAAHFIATYNPKIEKQIVGISHGAMDLRSRPD